MDRRSHPTRTNFHEYPRVLHGSMLFDAPQPVFRPPRQSCWAGGGVNPASAHKQFTKLDDSTFLPSFPPLTPGAIVRRHDLSAEREWPIVRSRPKYNPMSVMVSLGNDDCKSSVLCNKKLFHIRVSPSRFRRVSATSIPPVSPCALD
jgi:hypothetical protein